MCFEIWETPQALEKRNAREQRVARLQADLESSRMALSAELKEARVLELFKQHLALQDTLVAEILRARGPNPWRPAGGKDSDRMSARKYEISRTTRETRDSTPTSSGRALLEVGQRRR